jgi:peptidoglycan/LPS O-acetylase OafA/YrhL
MRFKAAVLHATGGRFSIEDVRLEPLAPDDVLVRLHASGLCHTDLEVIDGALPYPLPIVLGHEGALARLGSTGPTRRAIAWTAVLALLALMVEARARYPAVLSLPVVVTLSGALVVLASRQTGWILPGTGPLGRTLDWTGLRSYGIYLINWPLLWLLDGLWPGARTLDSAGLATFLAGWLGLTAMLTELCFRWMERPLIARGARCAARFGSPGAITTGERH